MQTRSQSKQSTGRISQPSSPTTRSQTQSARAQGFSKTPVQEKSRRHFTTGMTTRSGNVYTH